MVLVLIWPLQQQKTVQIGPSGGFPCVQAAGWAERQLSLPGLLAQAALWQGWLYLYCGLGRAWLKTSWAKSTAVGSRLSLLPRIFSPLKHLLLWPIQMSCSYHLSRAGQLLSKWRIGLFNFWLSCILLPFKQLGGQGEVLHILWLKPASSPHIDEAN